MSVIAVEKQGPVAILTLNRPEAMNPLGQKGDGSAVQAICEEINADRSIRCTILTGAGRAFSAGGDLKAMADPEGPFAGEGIKMRDHYRHGIHRLARALYGLDMPVIAAVNGPAIGLGCDVACLADVRIASDRAKFGVTFLKLGLVPGDGGSWVLPRVIGMSRAAELFFSGDVIDAATAEKWGLVNRVVPHDTLMDEAMAMATKFAAMPMHSLRLTKVLLREGQNTSYDTALEMAANAQVVAQGTPDFREGVSALLEKRTPQFNRG